MLRALIFGLTILHLGPGLAFIALAFGCDPTQPLLGVLCQESPLRMFLGITVATWVVLGAGACAVAMWRRGSQPPVAQRDIGEQGTG